LPIREFDERLGRAAGFAEQLHDARASRRHAIVEMVRQRVFGILAGYEDQNDHDTLRSDALFKIVAGRRPDAPDLASQPTLSRLENAVTASDLLRLENPYTVLVAAADACSASRPGARRETLDRYIKRMEELESIATSFNGVEQAFAIQAGRELRVLTRARETTDETAAKICHDIARAFEERLTYPGEIKVTVLRESRFTDVAR
jgi:hypothetical protein